MAKDSKFLAILEHSWPELDKDLQMEVEVRAATLLGGLDLPLDTDKDLANVISAMEVFFTAGYLMGQHTK